MPPIDPANKELKLASPHAREYRFNNKCMHPNAIKEKSIIKPILLPLVPVINDLLLNENINGGINNNSGMLK